MIKRFKKDNESKKLFLNSCSDYYIDSCGSFSSYNDYNKIFERGSIDFDKESVAIMKILDRLDIWEKEPKPFGVFRNKHNRTLSLGFMEKSENEDYPFMNVLNYTNYENFKVLRTMEEIQEYER